MKIITTIKSFAVSALIIAMNVLNSQASDYTILAFGDSLTAGYGLPAENGFTHKLEQKLKKDGLNITVFNGGVSGDTSSGGLARLEWVLSSVNNGKPDLVILELGANDALRGITPEITRSNIKKMLEILKKNSVNVLVAGMIAPPNMGEDYGNKFNPIYPELAKEYNYPLYPFFLDGVAGNKSLNQDDAMHPNANGVDEIVKRISPKIREILLRKTASKQ